MKKWAKELNIQWQKDWEKPNGFQDPRKVPSVLKEYAKKVKESCKKEKQPPKGKYVLLINYGKNKIKKNWIAKAYPKRKSLVS